MTQTDLKVSELICRSKRILRMVWYKESGIKCLAKVGDILIRN